MGEGTVQGCQVRKRLFASLSSASTVQISCSLATAAAAASGVVVSVLADRRFGQDCHNKLIG